MEKTVKYFLFLIVIGVSNIVFANTYSSINYTIIPEVAHDTPFIKVTVEIKGRFLGEIIFNFPYKWAGTEYSKQIKNIKLSYPKGKIKFKNIVSNSVVVTIPETNNINLSYEIHQKHNNPDIVRETIIRKDLIHATGYGLLVTPNELKDKKIEFSTTWKNIPKEWKALSSYGTDKSLKFVATIPQLLHAIYMAGNLRVYQIANPNSPVYLSLYGNFALKDAFIISDLSEIIKTQRSFFNDYNFPYYSISLIESDNHNSWGGTKLQNNFTANLPREINRLECYVLFAHEHLHNWTGGKIQNNEQEELNYWWTEGFTEYYSRVLALRSGGISIEKFIDECNQFLRAYYLSPVVNEPNKRIKLDFWKDMYVEKLPYYRGFVFAVYLNYLIKKSNPNNSLDNVILDLFKSTQHKKFSITNFKDIAKAYIHEGIDREISMFIDKGKTIELSDAIISLPLEKTTMGVYDPGFSKQAFMNEKIIKKINKRSNAYKVGLRDGDKVIEWSITKGRLLEDPVKIITIKTTNKVFEFAPESQDKKRNIYQFRSNLTSVDDMKIKKMFGVKKSGYPDDILKNILSTSNCFRAICKQWTIFVKCIFFEKGIINKPLFCTTKCW